MCGQFPAYPQVSTLSIYQCYAPAWQSCLPQGTGDVAGIQEARSLPRVPCGSYNKEKKLPRKSAHLALREEQSARSGQDPESGQICSFEQACESHREVWWLTASTKIVRIVIDTFDELF